ncbi:MAG: response regulator, partial [Oscillospiraceae bacterium]|nr:response regulator [Oscillospiraceae bacterium]
MSLGVKEIRVMVVDDSILARNLIISGLSEHPHINVVGYAVNALDAQRKIPQLQPDVLTLDVEMPGMSGIEFLKQLMRTNPMPVVLVSSLNPNVFDALSDAVDFVQKPDGRTDKQAFIDLLTKKVIAASKARVYPKPQAAGTVVPPQVTSIPPFGPSATLDRMVVGLGASTGGTEATLEVMKRLPADIPAMLIVQHMPPGFTKMYADRLNRLCRMEVREAQDGDTLHRGLALVAPADYQMRIVRSPKGGYAVTCRSGERVSGHRPSV